MIPARIVSVKRFPLSRSSLAFYQLKRNASSSEDTLPVDSGENLPEYSEEEVTKICNKSKLRADHHRIYASQHPQIPDDKKPQYMRTLKWQRKLIGRCGFEGQYDPGICFATKEEMEDLTEYEKVAHDVPLLEIRKKELERLDRVKKERYEREEAITKALAKQDAWMKEIRARMETKDEDAEQAKAERARLLEEVRRFFGYTIDPKDEKFQIMLAMKERELSKERQQEKKKARERQFMEKLASMEVGTDSSSSKADADSKKTKTKP